MSCPSFSRISLRILITESTRTLCVDVSVDRAVRSISDHHHGRLFSTAKNEHDVFCIDGIILFAPKRVLPQYPRKVSALDETCFLHRIVAKTFCVDFLSIVLAFASGIIFGGVVQGALVSTACATIASGLGFQLARTKLRTQVETQVKGMLVFFFHVCAVL